MSRIKFQYRVIDRNTGKTINIHPNREDARETKRDWKASGVDAFILQSKYVYVFSKEVR